MHARGDLVQFLESEGFEVGNNELTEDIRASALMHAQSLAMSRSQLFRAVLLNSERELRKVEFQQTAKTVDYDLDDDEDENVW
jgi:hypothetical protein